MAAPKDTSPARADEREETRLQEVRSVAALITRSDHKFDEITQLAAASTNSQMAAIYLLDSPRAKTLSSFGFRFPDIHAAMEHRCFVKDQQAALVQEDTAAHSEFSQHPLVQNGPKAKAYAAVPLITSNHVCLGFLAVLGVEARAFPAPVMTSLTTLSRIIVDILERKKVESQLEERTKFLNNVLSMVPDLVHYIDHNYCYQYNNEAYRQWFGIAPESLKGKPMWELIGKTAFAMAKPVLDRALAGERIDMELTLPLPMAGEIRTRHVIAHYFPDTLSAGKARGLFAVVSDVTALKESYKRIVEQAKMASLGEMASGIAHEINNPLTIILGRCDNVLSAKGEQALSAKDCATQVESIKRTADRIVKIVSGLRTFARQGDSDPMLTCSYGDIIHNTIELCKDRLGSSQVSLAIKIDRDLQVECRATQISQVLLNLINNACDAVQELTERWIEVKLGQGQDHSELRVTDSGSGIPEAVVSRMMQAFFTTKGVGKGTGLGLSISRGIAEAHSGTLSYELHGGHTSFVLRLPLAQPHATAEPAA